MATLFNTKWHHLINDLNYSTEDFFQIVKEIILKQEIPEIKYGNVSYSSGSIFSIKREYLRVTYREHMFEICAVSFGKGFFVSWWLGQSTSGAMQEFTGRLPFIGPFILKVAKPKTNYETDNENMFKECINGCIMEAVDQISREKGIPELKASERKLMEILK